MHYSPLKNKFNLTLNTSRGARASMQDSYTGFSKSPFKCGTDLIMKCNQLEQELHRANQQRKLQSLELDDLRNQFLKKSKALQECEYENTILQQQLQAARQQDDIQKLQNMLRQKNQIILEWSNKFSCVQKKLENENNLEQQLHKQQLENEGMKQQLNEIRNQQKLMQDNYRELKEERNNYYQKIVELSNEQQKSSDEENKQIQQQIAQLKKEKQEFENKLKQILQKKDKWKIRYKNFKNEIEYNQIQSRKSSEQLQQETVAVDELNEIKDKLQQLEVENQYLREQNMDLQTQIQSATDKLLKQQLQNSMSRDQSQAFSFQQYHQDFYQSYQEQEEQE